MGRVKSAKRKAPRARPLKSALGRETWSLVSTHPNGRGLISGGMTHPDAWATANKRYDEGHNGVVVMTDEAASRIGARPIDVAEIRDPKTLLVSDAEMKSAIGN